MFSHPCTHTGLCSLTHTPLWSRAKDICESTNFQWPLLSSTPAPLDRARQPLSNDMSHDENGPQEAEIAPGDPRQCFGRRSSIDGDVLDVLPLREHFRKNPPRRPPVDNNISSIQNNIIISSSNNIIISSSDNIIISTPPALRSERKAHPRAPATMHRKPIAGDRT